MNPDSPQQPGPPRPATPPRRPRRAVRSGSVPAESPVPAEAGEWETPVHDRHLVGLGERGDHHTFRAMMVQARHVTSCSYETTLYDHQQTFRLLWRHLERTGYLHRVQREAGERLGSGHLSAGERADLELFLTINDGVHPGCATTR